jgi:3'-phosphoadenosine 5'-phosphosulfate sulfotransferase (PAPS reductase)/FAD synthetase
MTPPELRALVRQGAILYVSHSGGKDSQAMYAHLRRTVPHERIVVVHADLGRIEWEGVQDHIRATIAHELHVVRAEKTFFDMVRHRHRTRPDVPSFPDGGRRQCTSDLKRNPIYKFIRRDMAARGALLGINVIGLRAEESAGRKRLPPWSRNRTLSTATRIVHDWLPIHGWTTEQVFRRIRQAGQEPFHAYASGNRRLSCVFCILGCAEDLANGRRQRPELFQEYLALERETGWTLFPGQSLAQRADEGEPRRPPPGRKSPGRP